MMTDLEIKEDFGDFLCITYPIMIFDYNNVKSSAVRNSFVFLEKGIVPSKERTGIYLPVPNSLMIGKEVSIKDVFFRFLIQKSHPSLVHRSRTGEQKHIDVLEKFCFDSGDPVFCMDYPDLELKYSCTFESIVGTIETI